MKLCLFCEHLVFLAGDSGYSDVTPGWYTILRCDKGKWDINDDFDDLHNSMLMAENCKYYSIDPWAKDKYGLKEDG